VGWRETIGQYLQVTSRVGHGWEGRHRRTTKSLERAKGHPTSVSRCVPINRYGRPDDAKQSRLRHQQQLPADIDGKFEEIKRSGSHDTGPTPAGRRLKHPNSSI